MLMRVQALQVFIRTNLQLSLWVYGTFAGDHVFAAQWDYGSTPG